MSRPQDPSSNGDSHDPPTSFRDLRASLATDGGGDAGARADQRADAPADERRRPADEAISERAAHQPPKADAGSTPPDEDGGLFAGAFAGAFDGAFDGAFERWDDGDRAAPGPRRVSPRPAARSAAGPAPQGQPAPVEARTSEPDAHARMAARVEPTPAEPTPAQPTPAQPVRAGAARAEPAGAQPAHAEPTGAETTAAPPATTAAPNGTGDAEARARRSRVAASEAVASATGPAASAARHAATGNGNGTVSEQAPTVDEVRSHQREEGRERVSAGRHSATQDDGGHTGGAVPVGGPVVTPADVLGLIGPPDSAAGRAGDANGDTGHLLPVRPPPGTDLDSDLDPADYDDDIDLPAVVRPRRLRDRGYRRRHGVAPFVPPSARRSRRKRRRDYRKLGFIELTQEKMRLRHRIFPRTVLGISAMILAFGIGTAVAGATLYAYYDYRLSQNETSVETFASGFDDVFASAISQLNGVRDQAVSSVNNSLGPLQAWQGEVNAVVDLPNIVGGGVWTLRSADTAGKPVIGSAFVVSSDATSSLLLTAHELVAAATAQPGPKVTLEKGGEQLSAEVWSWDPENDLALVKLPKGNLPAIAWAPEAVRAGAVGTRLYAVSGLGGAGAKAVSGMVIDQSTVGLQHNVPLSPDFLGGPLVTATGQVLAVATSTYRPLGFDPGPLPYAPDITTACRDQKVLVCPAALTGQR